MINLDEIERRANDATPGNWMTHGVPTASMAYPTVYVGNVDNETFICETEYDEDALFIASARADVPALVALCRTQQALLAEATVRVESMQALMVQQQARIAELEATR